MRCGLWLRVLNSHIPHPASCLLQAASRIPHPTYLALTVVFGFRIGFLEFGWADAADVLLVSLLMYELYRLIRGSVAGGILLGGIILYLVYQVVRATGMELLTSILAQFMSVGVVAALILFQQEIRRFLLLLGQGSAFRQGQWLRTLFSGPGQRREAYSVQGVLDAAKQMSQQHTGALIVFARSSDLSFYAETGDEIDALAGKRLLLSIFANNSPLHDGAAILEGPRLRAARCILPVSENPEVPASLGLRHRAALGLTELTDALVLIVSEETGQISIALAGHLEANLSSAELRARLNYFLFEREGAKAE